MEIIKDDELIYVNDKKTGINSCGYNVNSLLFNSGISPIMTLNEKGDNKDKNKENNSTFSSLFNNLVVPNWALHYEPHNAKIDSKLDDNSSFEIVDDNLYDKLMDLAIYKDPFFNTNNDNIMTAGNEIKRKKHNKTKHKLQKNIDVKNQNKNQKKKHKKTRKK